MIFFSGWGALLVPLWFVVGAFVGSGVRALTASEKAAAFAGGIVAAALCWWSGRRLNNPARDRIAVDRQTGADIRISSRHTLMFVPIQYYAVLLLALFWFIGATS